MHETGVLSNVLNSLKVLEEFFLRPLLSHALMIFVLILPLFNHLPIIIQLHLDDPSDSYNVYRGVFGRRSIHRALLGTVLAVAVDVLPPSRCSEQAHPKLFVSGED